MPRDSLALAAAFAVVTAEFTVKKDLRIAAGLVGLSIVFLLAAGRVWYFLPAVTLAIALACGGIAHYYQGANETIVHPKKLNSRKRVIVKWCAGFIHVFGVWMIPVMVLWGWTSVYGHRRFLAQEVAHALTSNVLFASMVVVPLFLGPPGHEKPTLSHQVYESLFNLGWSTISLIIFALIHLLGGGEGRDSFGGGEGGDSLSKIPVADWIHLQLGLVWAIGGMIGIFYAQQRISSSVHVVFPAAWISFLMINHSSAYPGYEVSSRMHVIHAICFGAGSVCRLFHRVPESIVFFFVGSSVFSVAGIHVSAAMSYWLPKDKEGDDTSASIPSLVTMSSFCIFPLHAFLLVRLRQAMDTLYGGDSDPKFTALSTKDDEETAEV